ncbi:MAG: alpha/beta hydrolase [Acidobacteriota bacterium]
MSLRHVSVPWTWILSFALAVVAGGCGGSDEPHEGYASVGGRRLFYETRGSGCPVLFIGGGSAMDSRQWSEVMAALEDSTRVLRYDPAAIGQSDVPRTSFSEEGDLLGLLDELGISRAVVVGNSSAGGLALEFALASPDRTRAVVAIAPFVPGWEFSPEMQERVDRFGKALSEGVDAFLRAALADPYFVPAPDNPAARRTAGNLIRNNYQKMLSIDPALIEAPSLPLMERVGSIQVPVLLLVGELDHPDLHRRVNALDRLIPISMTLEVPASGHTPTLENPRELAGTLGSFLDEIGWRGEGCDASGGR